MHTKNILSILIIIALSWPGLRAQSVYELSWPKDGILVGAGLPLLYFGFQSDRAVKPLRPDELINLDRCKVNGFDRIATYHYSEEMAQISDFLVYTCLASPILLLLSQQVRQDAGVIYSMYGEALIYGLSLPLIVKGGVTRFRPYVYNPDLPESIKLTSDARKSFFSGHTSLAFTSTFFFASVYSSYYPNSKARTYVWSGATLLALSVGYLRIASGSHYPSDVLAGAMVGIAAGYLIQNIHKISDHSAQNPYVAGSANNQILAFSFNF